MCCDLAGSVGSREHWLWDTARKRNAFLLFSIVLKSFNCYSFGTIGPLQVGFSAKCTSPNEDFNQIENWKCHLFDFRLIPLGHITYDPIFWAVYVTQHIESASCWRTLFWLTEVESQDISKCGPKVDFEISSIFIL